MIIVVVILTCWSVDSQGADGGDGGGDAKSPVWRRSHGGGPCGLRRKKAAAPDSTA